MNALIEGAREIREEHLSAYLTLARRIVLDEQVTAEQVESACVAAGKTPDQFESLIKQLEHRQRIRAQIATLESVEAELFAVQSQIQAEEQKKDEAIAAFVRVTHPLHQRLNTLRDRVGTLHTLKGQLIRTADPELKKLVRYYEGREQETVDARRQLDLQLEEIEVRMTSADPRDRPRLEIAKQTVLRNQGYFETQANELRQRREEITREMEAY